MIQKFLVQILLSPISILYGIGVGFRNFLYNNKFLKGVSFNLPIISIGNLSVGGAGKTPHIEYLIRLLSPYLEVGTLSRGYKRETKGYINVHVNHDAKTVGDEPLQFKRKYRDILVAVDENRIFGVSKLLMEKDSIQTILLDDAFQHRSITPGLNILLTEYDKPFTKDFLLPSGRLREWRSAYKRADIVVVSKCPEQITAVQRNELAASINPLPKQRLFFSHYRYGNPYYIFNSRQRIRLDSSIDVLLICAIAGTNYLLNYLEGHVGSVRALEYEDHHNFTNFELGSLERTFNEMPSSKKLILTTEKDAMRLELHRKFIIEKKMPIFALPIEVHFNDDDGPAFDQLIQSYLLEFKA